MNQPPILIVAPQFRIAKNVSDALNATVEQRMFRPMTPDDPTKFKGMQPDVEIWIAHASGFSVMQKDLMREILLSTRITPRYICSR